MPGAFRLETFIGPSDRETAPRDNCEILIITRKRVLAVAQAERYMGKSYLDIGSYVPLGRTARGEAGREDAHEGERHEEGTPDKRGKKSIGRARLRTRPSRAAISFVYATTGR
ncbi:hypothetical protein KM043_009200 [Ampulex compressa]|nr:hypothetical protein KM043_009200 [Ampulex compressa]